MKKDEKSDKNLSIFIHEMFRFFSKKRQKQETHFSVSLYIYSHPIFDQKTSQYYVFSTKKKVEITRFGANAQNAHFPRFFSKQFFPVFSDFWRTCVKKSGQNLERRKTCFFKNFVDDCRQNFIFGKNKIRRGNFFHRRDEKYLKYFYHKKLDGNLSNFSTKKKVKKVRKFSPLWRFFYQKLKKIEKNKYFSNFQLISENLFKNDK